MIEEGYAWAYDGGTKQKNFEELREIRDSMGHSFDLTMEDYTIILNALHYYKKVEKHPNFAQYDEDRIVSTRQNGISTNSYRKSKRS